MRYAADNDQRSSKYDDLLAAEDKAQKSNKGKEILHKTNLTNEKILRDIELSLNVT